MAQLTQGKRGRSKKASGLYQGKAGGYAAQQNPQAFATTKLQRAGLPLGSSPSFDQWWNTVGYQSLYGGYQTALAGNERLTFKDYMKRAPGGSLRGQVEGAFQRYQADTEPLAFYTGRQYAQGDATGSGTEQERILLEDLANVTLGKYRGFADRYPTASFMDYLNGQPAPRGRSIFAPGAKPIKSGGTGGGGKKRGKGGA